MHVDSRSATASGDAQILHAPKNAPEGAVDSNTRVNMIGAPATAQDGRQLEDEVPESPLATSGATHFQAPQVSMLGTQNQTYLNRTYDEYQEQE